MSHPRGRSFDEIAFAAPAAPVRIARAGTDLRCKHAFAPSIHRHSNGQLVCLARWDDQGEAEGDSSNKQALFFSLDDGATWTMANGAKPIVTLEMGTSFDRPSSITHSFLYQEQAGATWIYYCVNQPHTRGTSSPDRSTGGGEIRRIRIDWQDRDWRAIGESEIAWGFTQPLSRGDGDYWTDVRLVSLNPPIRASSGSLLMAVAGRSTVNEPAGHFWKLNRCWVLESVDDGQTWTSSHFIGGSDSLCLCEPTIVETSQSGSIVAYMRAQYETGTELYRSESFDFGHSWTSPKPTGLPNNSGSGSKPFLAKWGGRYLLLLTNEQDRSDRTSLAVFVALEEDFKSNRWSHAHTVSTECRSHWEGACYGSIDASDSSRALLAFVSFTKASHFINFYNLLPSHFEATGLEAKGVSDTQGNHLPAEAATLPRKERALHFPNVRSQAQLTRFLNERDYPAEIQTEYRIDAAPQTREFHFIDARANYGRHGSFRASLRPKLSRSLWLWRNGDWIDTELTLAEGDVLALSASLIDRQRFELNANTTLKSHASTHFFASTDPPNTLYFGGGLAPEACSIFLQGARLA